MIDARFTTTICSTVFMLLSCIECCETGSSCCQAWYRSFLSSWRISDLKLRKDRRNRLCAFLEVFSYLCGWNTLVNICPRERNEEGWHPGAQWHEPSDLRRKRRKKKGIQSITRKAEWMMGLEGPCWGKGGKNIHSDNLKEIKKENGSTDLHPVCSLPLNEAQTDSLL